MLREIILSTCFLILTHGRSIENRFNFHVSNGKLDKRSSEWFRRFSNYVQPDYKRDQYFVGIERKRNYDGLYRRGSAAVYAIRGYQESCSDGMQKIRDALGDPPLHWDQNLSIEAEKYAISMATTGRFAHSSTHDGENIFDENYTNDNDRSKRLSCSFPLWSWYSERYDPRTQRGHFLQMVGERVKKFGFGVAVNINTKMIYVVARFDYNMPSQGEDLVKYMESKEKWVIPNRERLVSKRGELSSISQ
jgi:hypothetical protein